MRTVRYDDGEREDLNLSKERFKLLPDKLPAKPSRGVRASSTLAQGQPAVPQGLEDSDVEMSAGGTESAGGDESDDDFDDSVLSSDRGASSSGEESLDDEAADSEEEAADTDSGGARTKAKSSRQAAALLAKKRAAAKPLERTLEVDRLSPECGCRPGAAAAVVTPKTPACAAGTRTTLGQVPRSGQLLECLTGGSPAGGDAAFGGGATGSAANDSVGRFSQRYSSAKFSFMSADNLCDANRRRPDDPNYDCSTCFIPADWFKAHKVSDGQRQWWEFKSANWDSVLLFKMGKCGPLCVQCSLHSCRCAFCIGVGAVILCCSGV
jgi:DNA mismatch repair protein MSH6